ncbi:MAG: hypothetical protein IPQ08_08135 [Chitinophagaceae bacterium]|nr:hypothetical protein [Chitinophagaceae bacterium]
MKKMLYAGAALMIGASIYGFVDYKRTSQKKEFKTLYSEKKQVEKPNLTDEKTVVVEKADITEPVTNVKEVKKTNNNVRTEVKKAGTRKFRFKEFGRGRIPDEEEIVEEKEVIVADSVTAVHKK